MIELNKMKPSLLIFAAGIAVLSASGQQKKSCPIQPVDLTYVRVDDQFLAAKLQVHSGNQTVEIGLVRLNRNEWKVI